MKTVLSEEGILNFRIEKFKARVKYLLLKNIKVYADRAAIKK
jgi:hypothetical protein